jgi:PKD repeat protein
MILYKQNKVNNSTLFMGVNSYGEFNMKKLVLFFLLFNRIIGQLFSQSNCPNSDFSQGSFIHWEGYYGTFYEPAKYYGFAANRHVINTLPGFYDQNTCNGLFILPPGETYSARLGNDNTGAEAEQLRYSLTVTPETNLFIYKYAVVLEDPGHIPENQPSFTIEVTDENGVIIDPICGYYYVYAQQGLPGWSTCGNVVWKNWTTVGLNLDPYLGENITIVFTTRDCEQTGHFGYAYLSASCGKLQMEISYCPQNNLATLTAPSGFTYLWNNGQTSQSININNPNPGQNYSCILTAVNGCQVTIYATIHPTIVNSDFNFIANCAGLPIYFTDMSTINQNEIIDWKWYFDDGSLPLTGNPNPVHTYFNSGIFYVKLITYSTEGCSDTIIKPVNVYPNPNADFAYTPQCQYNPISFFDSSTINQGSISNWEWNFDDESLPLTGNPNPIHHYELPGIYNVKLITFSSEGCIDTIVKQVIVNPFPIIQFYQNNSLITTDSIVLCPLDSVVNLNVNNCGISYHWTKKSEPNWASNSQSIILTNPGMGLFVESYYILVTNEFDCISKDTIHILWDFIGCVGINEVVSNILGIYPNPTNGLIYLDFDQPVYEPTIELFNIEGKKIFSQKFINHYSSHLSFDFTGYYRGIYYLRVFVDDEAEIIKLILY